MKEKISSSLAWMRDIFENNKTKQSRIREIETKRELFDKKKSEIEESLDSRCKIELKSLIKSLPLSF